MRDRKKRKTQTRLDDKVLSWAAKKGRNNWLRGGLRSRRLARQLSTTQDKQRSSVRLAVGKVPSARRHLRRETRSRVLFNCLLLLLRRAAQLTREVAPRNKQASSLRPNKSKVEYSRREEGSARSRRGSRAVLVAKRDERLTTFGFVIFRLRVRGSSPRVCRPNTRDVEDTRASFAFVPCETHQCDTCKSRLAIVCSWHSIAHRFPHEQLERLVERLSH